jgi:predicted HAD superfamily phosphohydrolase
MHSMHQLYGTPCMFDINITDEMKSEVIRRLEAKYSLEAFEKLFTQIMDDSYGFMIHMSVGTKMRFFVRVIQMRRQRLRPHPYR